MGQPERSAAELEKEHIRKENLRKAWGDEGDLSTIKAFRSEEYPVVDEVDEWFDKHFFSNDDDGCDD